MRLSFGKFFAIILIGSLIFSQVLFIGSFLWVGIWAKTDEVAQKEDKYWSVLMILVMTDIVAKAIIYVLLQRGILKGLRLQHDKALKALSYTYIRLFENISPKSLTSIFSYDLAKLDVQGLNDLVYWIANITLMSMLLLVISLVNPIAFPILLVSLTLYLYFMYKILPPLLYAQRNYEGY